MPRKKPPSLSFVEQMHKLSAAGLNISTVHPTSDAAEQNYSVENLSERIRKIIGIIQTPKRPPGRMLFFVMYDIESNKVRTLVHKYLKRMGCTPIQHSVFLADTSIETYNRIKEDLAAVQEAYDNDDSILVAPVSSDYLKMMKIIGHKIELDVITHSRSTLFF